MALEQGFGLLNASQRLDYQLLSSDVEVVTNYIASAKGHGSYWTSADFVMGEKYVVVLLHFKWYAEDN